MRDEADVLLYLVNAAETPEAAGYVAPEMELLGWIGKPVLVLLNQLGAPRAGDVEAAEVERWRASLSALAHVRGVLPLDAFARCWVQERAARGRRGALPKTARPRWRACARRGARARVATFDASMRRSLAAAWRASRRCARRVAEGGGCARGLRQAGAASASAAPSRGAAPRARSARSPRRLDDEVRAEHARLLALHGLDGAPRREIRERLAARLDLRLRLDEAAAAIWGGAVSGALGGLEGRPAERRPDARRRHDRRRRARRARRRRPGARAQPRARHRAPFVAWNGGRARHRSSQAALLRYLAVAHFGRGRGQWVEGEAPPHWAGVVAAALAPQREALAAAWSERAGGTRPATPAALARALAPVVGAAARSVAARRCIPTAGRF